MSNHHITTIGVDCQCALRTATLHRSNIERATNVVSVRSNCTGNGQNGDNNNCDEECMQGALGLCSFAKACEQKTNLQHDVSEEQWPTHSHDGRDW